MRPRQHINPLQQNDMQPIYPRGDIHLHGFSSAETITPSRFHTKLAHRERSRRREQNWTAQHRIPPTMHVAISGRISNRGSNPIYFFSAAAISCEQSIEQAWIDTKIGLA